MCMKTPKPPPVPAPPPPAAPAPEEIENAVDSTAEQQKKRRKGKKQLNRSSSGLQIGSVSSKAPSTPNVGN